MVSCQMKKILSGHVCSVDESQVYFAGAISREISRSYEVNFSSYCCSGRAVRQFPCKQSGLAGAKCLTRHPLRVKLC